MNGQTDFEVWDLFSGVTLKVHYFDHGNLLDSKVNQSKTLLRPLHSTSGPHSIHTAKGRNKDPTLLDF